MIPSVSTSHDGLCQPERSANHEASALHLRERSVAWSAMMAAAQRGDSVSYRRLLQEMTQFVRRFGRARGIDPASCEDLAQDVIITLHRVRHTYDPERPFMPWMLSIVNRRLIDLYRRDRRIRDKEVVMPAAILDSMADPDSEAALLAAESRQWLAVAIRMLPPKQRRALVLVKLQQLSVAEAASRAGQSLAAVKVNAHRGLLALRALVAIAPITPPRSRRAAEPTATRNLPAAAS